jgi:hypothetical protein
MLTDWDDVTQTFAFPHPLNQQQPCLPLSKPGEPGNDFSPLHGVGGENRIEFPNLEDNLPNFDARKDATRLLSVWLMLSFGC